MRRTDGASQVFQLLAQFRHLAAKLLQFFARSFRVLPRPSSLCFQLAPQFASMAFNFHRQVRSSGGAQILHGDVQMIEPTLQFGDTAAVPWGSGWPSAGASPLPASRLEFLDLANHVFRLFFAPFAPFASEIRGVFPQFGQPAVNIPGTLARTLILVTDYDAAFDDNFLPRRRAYGPVRGCRRVGCADRQMARQNQQPDAKHGNKWSN